MNTPTIPQDVILEMSVLGGIMLEPRVAYPLVASIITERDFYLSDHALIFRTMGKLHAEGLMSDSIALIERLRATGQLEKAGGSGVVMGMLNSVPTAANVEYHSRILLDHSQRREMMQLALHTCQDAANRDKPLDQTIQQWSKRVEEIASRSVSPDEILPLREIAQDEAERLCQLYNTGEPLERVVTTGFNLLDHAMGGFVPGDLVVWSARPNTGKTRILLYSLASCTLAGENVGFISLDMSQQRLLKYLIPTAYNVRGHNAYDYELYSPHMWGEAEEANLRDICAQADPDGRFWLVSNPRNTSILTLEGYMRQMAKHGCSVVAIDQAQNIQGWDQGGRDRSFYAAIVGACKRMARVYGLAVVLVHQIQRAGAEAPTIANLKDTGCTEEYSDAVVILHDHQRTMIDNYDGFVREASGIRKPHADEEEIKIQRQIDVTRPIRIDLAKTRNESTQRKDVMFDFARGVKA